MPSDEGPQFYSVRESVPIKEIPPFPVLYNPSSFYPETVPYTPAFFPYLLFRHPFHWPLRVQTYKRWNEYCGTSHCWISRSEYKISNRIQSYNSRRTCFHQKVLYGRMKPDAIQFPESNPSALYPPYEIPTPLCHALFFQQQYRCPMKVPPPATHHCYKIHHRNS